MKADELQDYLNLDIAKKGTFSNNELDEFILMVYNMVNWSIRDGCDTIEVDDKQVLRCKGEKILDQFPTPFNFNPAFKKVLERDKIIQSHLKLVSKSSNKFIYKLFFT